MDETETRATLDELAILHDTDKRSGRHNFASVYSPFLEPLREHEITLLELGVKHGASVRMWRDYFPRGRICGVDINRTAAAHADDRIEIFIGGQADKALLDEVVEQAGGFDVIIDDGSHRYPDQRDSLVHLWPHLRAGGIYVMEDVHTSYAPRYEMGFRQRESTIEMLKDVVDDIHVNLHKQQRMLRSVTSIHFFHSTCIMIKGGPPAAR